MRDEGDGAGDVSSPPSRFDLVPPRRPRLSAPERAVLVASLLVLAGSLALLVSRLLDDPGQAPAPAATTATAAAPPAVPPVLLAHQGPSGGATSITVLAPSAGGRGGSLVFVPPGTMTEVVSVGLEPVGRSLELGGPSRLQATVENLLGVRLAAVVVLGDEQLAALLEPVGPLPVDVPERVDEVSDAGRVEVVYPAGPLRLEPAEAGRFLALRGEGSDLQRLARHQVFWEAWLAALRRQPGAVPAEPAEVMRAFSALVAGTVRSRVVPVESIGSGGEDEQLYRVRSGELRRLVGEAFPPGSRPAPGDRLRVQILNGTGAVGLAELVRNRLGPGYDVRFTGNAATFDQERTQVVYYDQRRRQDAERLREALGVGEVVRALRPLDVIDVTVVVGRDFRP